MPLGDDPPHALIGGPSGSGKTNLIYAWLGALAARYGPDELALYLLDFKEGVSFARFAPGPRDPSWLPQVRLAGVNVNGDREFGLAMLRHLGEELRARAQAAKRYEATKLSELRAEDPDGHWPRIVAVIDEFQVLLAGRDAVADEAVTLLEDLARRGRSQGIHLVLASQDVSGIEALWGRSGLIGQFTLRIALPKARRILADDNLAAAVIPRHHAVVNAESGAAGRQPDRPAAGRRRPRRLARAAAPALARPAGRLRTAAALRRRRGAPAARRVPAVRSGAGPAARWVPRPARCSASGSTWPPGRPGCGWAGCRGATWRCSAPVPTRPATCSPRPRCRWPRRDRRTSAWSACDPDAGPAGGPAGGRAARARLVRRRRPGRAVELPSGRDPALRARVRAGRRRAGPQTALRRLLDRGPGAAHPRAGLVAVGGPAARQPGRPGARLDAIGAWVALDVHGADLAPLYPQPGGPAWYPRRRRALFFDRSVHRTPEVIIPYEVNSDPRVTATTS